MWLDSSNGSTAQVNATPHNEESGLVLFPKESRVSALIDTDNVVGGMGHSPYGAFERSA